MGLGAGDFEVDAVEAGAGGDEESFAVLLAEGHVHGNFGKFDAAERFAFGRKNPQAVRAGGEDVAAAVDFHAVGNHGAAAFAEIVKELRVADQTIGIHGIARVGAAGRIVYDQKFFIGSKREAVGAAKILDQQIHFSILHAIHAGERNFARAFRCGKAIGRIGEIDGVVGFDDHVIGAADALAIVAIGDHRARAVFLEACDAAIAVLAKNQVAFHVNRQPIRAEEILQIGAAFVRQRLGRRRDCAVVSAVGEEHGNFAVAVALAHHVE